MTNPEFTEAKAEEAITFLDNLFDGLALHTRIEYIHEYEAIHAFLTIAKTATPVK